MARVRAATLLHLDHLLGLTALAALAASCSATAADKDAKATPEPPTTDPVKLGYSVVDELPMPAECTTFADELVAHVSLEGVGHLSVQISRRREQSWEDAAQIDGTTASAVHARIMARDPVPNSSAWLFDLVPEAATQAVALTVHGTCNGVKSAAQVEIRWLGKFAAPFHPTVVILPSGATATPGVKP